MNDRVMLYQTMNMLLGRCQQHREELAYGPLEGCVDARENLCVALMSVCQLTEQLSLLDHARVDALTVLQMKCANELTRLMRTECTPAERDWWKTKVGLGARAGR